MPLSSRILRRLQVVLRGDVETAEAEVAEARARLEAALAQQEEAARSLAELDQELLAVEERDRGDGGPVATRESPPALVQTVVAAEPAPPPEMARRDAPVPTPQDVGTGPEFPPDVSRDADSRPPAGDDGQSPAAKGAGFRVAAAALYHGPPEGLPRAKIYAYAADAVPSVSAKAIEKAILRGLKDGKRFEENAQGRVRLSAAGHLEYEHILHRPDSPVGIGHATPGAPGQPPPAAP